MDSGQRVINLAVNADFLERFETHAQSTDLDLNTAIKVAMAAAMRPQASEPATAPRDAAAREALTKLRQRTTALESLTAQMTTHMRILQEQVDQLAQPAMPSAQQRIADLLPTIPDDFAAEF